MDWIFANARIVELQVIAGEKEKIYYSSFGLKKTAGTLPSAASPCGAVARPASRPSGLRASVAPGRRAGQALEEVVAHRLELVADEPEVQELCSAEIMF